MTRHRDGDARGRIFLTEDRDFGQLVYAAAKPTQGVIPHRTREPISRPWCRTGGGARGNARHTVRGRPAGTDSVRTRSERLIACATSARCLRPGDESTL